MQPRGRQGTGPSYESLQEKRRGDALARQRSERLGQLQACRDIKAFLTDQGTVDAPTEDTLRDGTSMAGPVDSQMGESKKWQPRRNHRHHEGGQSVGQHQPHQGDVGRHRLQYGSQFMQPEWMTDVPSDLGVNWYVMPRPEGKRCLLISSGGRTTSRLRNGFVLHSLQSSLPEGSPASCSGSEACVLDCIFHEANSTYYVQDLLMWRGHPFLDCTAEFRVCWMQSKMAEAVQEDALFRASRQASAQGAAAVVPEAVMGDADSGPHLVMHRADDGAEMRLCALPVSVADPAGLAAAHAGTSAGLGLVRDGVYFLHREGHYLAGNQPCPLALLWKDEGCSRYVLDTDVQGVALDQQQVTLEYRMDGTVATADEPPVVLGKLPASFVEQNQKHLRPGRLLRFQIGQAGLMFHEGQPCGADLKYVGPGNQKRGRADHFSKIMFQYNARRTPITLEQLVHAAANPCSSMEEEEGQPHGTSNASSGRAGMLS